MFILGLNEAAEVEEHVFQEVDDHNDILIVSEKYKILLLIFYKINLSQDTLECHIENSMDLVAKNKLTLSQKFRSGAKLCQHFVTKSKSFSKTLKLCS